MATQMIGQKNGFRKAHALSCLFAVFALGCAADQEPFGGGDLYDEAYNNGGDYASQEGSAHLPPTPPPPGEAVITEIVENDFISTTEEAVSTFSIDVDTASYTILRHQVANGAIPAPDLIRIEEYINYFDYEYPEPADGSPFSINMEVAPSAFGEDLHMLRVGLKAMHIPLEDLRPANLVFLIDTSGSMSGPLELLRYSLLELLDNLRPQDTVALVTYAGNSGTLLEPTPVSERQLIASKIEQLTTSGSTNGESGIERAYELAIESRIEGGINRVVLVTDGDFNVGLTGQELSDYVQSMRDEHIGLTVAGMNVNPYSDAVLKSFAQHTNGNYVMIDSQEEADRAFGSEIASTLEVVAADVKIQVEFDSTAVARYRLVGYEGRVLDNEDFEDDAKDAGEIGPDHTVTALYEIELAEGVTSESGLIAEVRLRHKEAFGEASTEQTQQVKSSQVKASLGAATPDLKFAMAVVELGELLRESKHTTGDTIDTLRTLADDNATDTRREGFVELVDQVKPLLAARQ